MSRALPRTSSRARILFRRTAELALTGSGFAALLRRRSRGSTSVLAYHNVVPSREAGHADSSLHLPLPRFIAQIERLARTHDIVDLEDATGASDGTRPRAVITFDDAYRGAVTLALPELIRRRIPATVFVSPALLGVDATWWDALSAAGLLTGERRRAAMEELAGRREPIVRRWLSAAPEPRLPPSYGIASEEELRLHCGAGVTLGSHAWEHEYLPALGGEELEDSLRRTLEWLARFEGRTCSWLALPYGAGSAELGRTALDLGHEGVLRVAGGAWKPTRSGTAWVPRINVPAGMSLRGFELRTSGLR